MRMAADLVTDAYRVLVPLLEPEQCDALSDYLRGKLAELEAQAASLWAVPRLMWRSRERRLLMICNFVSTAPAGCHAVV